MQAAVLTGLRRIERGGAPDPRIRGPSDVLVRVRHVQPDDAMIELG